MSLHTKYRPKSFERVLGQEAITKSLANALEKGASHTFLLHGPSGTGKTTLARIAANFLGATGMSIQEIDAATFTGIDDIRQITRTLQHKPFEGKTRVLILDECHALSASAWKALLKALEEPPSWAYWFLCTTEVGKVPANVKTRCTSYSLKPVKTDKLITLLNSIVKKESMTIDEEIIALCAEEAQGSPRQAIVNLEVCGNCSTVKEAAGLLQAAGASPAVIDLARALLARKPWKAVQGLLVGLKDMNAESCRHVIRSYMTNVVLGAKNESIAGGAMEVLDAFSTPFPSSDAFSPVVLACGRLLLGE